MVAPQNLRTTLRSNQGSSSPKPEASEYVAPSINQIDTGEQEALAADRQLQERRKRRQRASSLAFGLWKDHEGGPPDGVEYQNRIRDEW